MTEVISYTDYYPFGMLMPNRYGSDVTPGDDYKYGMGGMEKDNEIAGNGNSYTTHFRQYDPRIARWTSIDPLFHNFPWQSPYVAFDNNPIYFNDPNGAASQPTPDRDTRVFNRLNIRINKLNKRGRKGRAKAKRIKGRRRYKKFNNRVNNGASTPKLANFGRGTPVGPDPEPDNYRTFTEPHDQYHTWGYSIARINTDGEIEVENIGTPAFARAALVLGTTILWRTGNSYGMESGSEIIFDENNNILGLDGEILIPVLKDLDGTEAFYGPDESLERELISPSKDVGTGVIIRSTLTVNDSDPDDLGSVSHADVTKKIKDENTKKGVK